MSIKMIPGGKTQIMGILNVTPDSFSDGGRNDSTESAIAAAQLMIADGADMIDVGGESTRPGAEPVSLEQEIARVIPVITCLVNEGVQVSIDSYKTQVVEAALNAGASMVNDINGLRSDGMAELVAGYGVPVCIMHMQGTPKDMQADPSYTDVVGEVRDFLRQRADFAVSKGVCEKDILIDPGIGFGKTVEHNLELIARIAEFRELGLPLLVGHSRKSFIAGVLDLPVDERLSATVAVSAYLALAGVEVLRVHDVRENREAVEMMVALSPYMRVI
ncbi:dihydropteroate synthase [Candidatus Altiarchaeota archaeon]